MRIAFLVGTRRLKGGVRELIPSYKTGAVSIQSFIDGKGLTRLRVVLGEG